MDDCSLSALREKEANPETDDFNIAFMVVAEQLATTPELKMFYMAKWVAKLREHYVGIGYAEARDDS